MKKLFTNDKFFKTVVILSVFCAILYIVFAAALGKFSFSFLAGAIIHIGCLLVLYDSYRKHSKNVMKGMMGAMLMERLLSSVSGVSTSSGIDFPFSVVFAVLLTALFINHFIINSEHHSSPAMVRLNQIIAILVFAVTLVWDLIWLFSSSSAMEGVLAMTDMIGFSGVVVIIVCVESRLDAYRLDREAAGWTEEAGYPEGYVHEYEKKK